MQATQSILWHELEDAYGPATEVPSLLAAAKSARGRKLFDAASELYSHVLHQGTIYSASPHVARELIDFAPAASAEHKSFAYGMLSGFAQAARKAIADGRAIPCHAGGDPRDGNAIRDIILAAHATFVPELKHSDPAVRLSVAELLTAFEAGHPASSALVRDLYLAESDANVRWAALQGLIRTSTLMPDWPGFLETAIARESDPNCRFALRYAQIREARTAATPAMVDDLIAAFVQPPSPDALEYDPADPRFFEALTWLGTSREREASLLALQLASQDEQLLAIARHLLCAAFDDRRTNWDQTSYSYLKEDGSPPPQGSLVRMAVSAIGRLILWKLFPWLMRRQLRTKTKVPGMRKIEFWGLLGDAPPIPTPLSHDQQAVLTALASKPELWQFRTNLWDLFHIPNTPAALRELASRHG